MAHPLTTEDAAAVLSNLAEAMKVLYAEIGKYGNDNDQQSSGYVADSDAPVLETFYQSGWSEAVLSVTSFSVEVL